MTTPENNNLAEQNDQDGRVVLPDLLDAEDCEIPVPHTGGKRRRLHFFFPATPYASVGKDQLEALDTMERMYKPVPEAEMKKSPIWSKYKFHEMTEVGVPHFYPSPDYDYACVKAAAMKWQRMNGVHFNVRKVKAGGTTVWRVK